MAVHSIVEAVDCPAAEQLLLTIGRAGVLSSRAIATGELEELLRLLGPPSERQRSDLKRATDIVLVDEGNLIYWPRTARCSPTLPMHGARASDADPMSTPTLKRELALLRSSLAALTPAQSATLDDPIAWAERIAGLPSGTARPSGTSGTSGQRRRLLQLRSRESLCDECFPGRV